MPDHLVAEEVLTLPYGTLATLHDGNSEVRLYSNLVTQTKQVGKRISLLGRENTVVGSEGALLREIRHANVAEVYDTAEVVGADPALQVVELVMPHYPGGSLLDFMLRGERASVGQARDFMVRALRGLAWMHERHRLLHRDVKPANLFLSDDGSLVKVGDLGETIRMGDDGSADPLLVPQFWTAPETFGGARHSVAAEVYSAGMCLQELLSGPFPYDDYTRESIAERLQAGRCAVRPRDLRAAPHAPPEATRVVNKATNLDPTRRYRSAEDMVHALLALRFIDWSWPVADDHEIVWHGTYGRTRLRVAARRRARLGWRVRGEYLAPSGWRRVAGSDEVDGHDPLVAAATVLSQVSKHLTRT